MVVIHRSGARRHKVSRLPAAFIAILVMTCVSCESRRDSEVGDSRLDATAPADLARSAALQRDLLLHFSSLSSIRVTAVEPTLLGEAPAQSGAGLRNYYAWVVLKDDQGQTRSGAVRVTTMDDAHFSVTDFLTRGVLMSDAGAAAKVFPSALLPELHRRAAD